MIRKSSGKSKGASQARADHRATFVREIADMNETSGPTSIAALTAEIVSAYVANNKIASSELGGLITTVAGQLSKVGGEPERGAGEKLEAVVSVRRSIRPDHLVCLICGKKQKLLKRHLAVEHDLTPNQYRETFGLKSEYPMAAPNYAQQRRELALKIGLGRSRKGRRRKSTARRKAPEPSQPATAEAGS
jgi:predicted transcriptional regulator